LVQLTLRGKPGRSGFWGEGGEGSIVCDSAAFVRDLNAGEPMDGAFVLVHSLGDEKTSPEEEEKNVQESRPFESDFLEEVSFFKSQIDIRLALFEVLKERGVWEQLLKTKVASLLEELTEAEVQSLLRASRAIVRHGLLEKRDLGK
jgi:hypothetical protein